MDGLNSVLVTGSNRGIGLELVRQLSTRERQPKFIFAACRNPNKSEELLKLALEKSNVHIIPLDLANEETYKKAFVEVEKYVGDSGLDMLINNAGIDDHASLEQLTAESLIESFKVNAVGTLMVTKTFLPLIRQAANRKDLLTKQTIINMSSQTSCLNATWHFLPGEHWPYKISKAAQNSMTVQLADGLRSEGITVIGLCPGWVRTEMGGHDAHLTPQESVFKILELNDKLSIKDTGKFYKYSGVTMDW